MSKHFPNARRRVPRATAEHVSFRGSGYGEVLDKLNEHLASYNPNYELASIQETNTGSRLATESTFEWWGTYLIAWRLRQ